MARINGNFAQRNQPFASVDTAPLGGQRFIISVDTEEEFDWDAPFQRSGHTTETVPKLERFQAFVEKFGVKPIYFVDYSIIEDDAAVEFLRDVLRRDVADVGVHLHPWVNPPFDEKVNEFNSFAGNLPKELERQKIINLLERIIDRTGYRPTVYRAGRYGIGPNTVAILIELGFAIDSSVRARFDYRHGGGPDFRNFGSQPLLLDAPARLIELPLTTVFSGMLRKIGGMVPKGPSPLTALLARSGLLQQIPLTPEGVSIREVREAIDIALDDGLDLLVFSFHSPSLMPGNTPYVKTEAELDRFYGWWRETLAHLANRGVKPLGMVAAGEALRRR
ncbi:MAG: polysaccharide deacetylase family protein [Parasphingorhabdus sp.]|nr:polysaccharide deacetylase family protein [Parasphingorhabdus sp.]